MRLAEPWTCFRMTTWLMLCLSLLALPACADGSLRPGRGLALSAQSARPQRTARIYRHRPVRAVPQAATLAIDFDEKRRLFQRFVEWQGIRDSGR